MNTVESAITPSPSHEVGSPQMHGTLGELPLALVQQRRCPLLRGELGNAPGQSVATPGIGRELFGVGRVAQAAVRGGFEEGQVADAIGGLFP